VEWAAAAAATSAKTELSRERRSAAPRGAPNLFFFHRDAFLGAGRCPTTIPVPSREISSRPLRPTRARKIPHRRAAPRALYIGVELPIPTVILVASANWNARGSSMEVYGRSVIETLRRKGVVARPLEVRTPAAGAPLGGIVLPVLYRRFLRYPRGQFVHATGIEGAGRGAAVTTIYDLWHFYAGGWAGYDGRDRIRLSARRSKLLIAISEYTRDELRKFLGRRVYDRTVTIGIPQPTVGASRPSVAKYDVVWVGTTQHRKRLPAFLRMVKQLPSSYSICVHWRGPRRDGVPLFDAPSSITAAIRQLQSAGLARVDSITETLQPDQLDLLYRASRCIVSTSTYEGLHLPVLEAYLRGTRVVIPRCPPYTELYVGAPGVHWYARDDQIPSAIAAAVESEPFEPSRKIREAVSFDTIGRQLIQAYESVGGARFLSEDDDVRSATSLGS
jgi:hypothetical protein